MDGPLEDQKWVAELADSIRKDIDREIVRDFGPRPRLVEGNYVTVLAEERVVKIVMVYDGHKPEETIVWFYTTFDILTERWADYREDELSEPLCEMEVLAWVSKTKS